MKPWCRFIFIFIAYGFALLHTAVPHHHPEVINGRTTISQAGCRFNPSMGGFLQKVFSTDLGYGHLETFQKGTDTDIDLAIAGISVIAPLVPLVSLPAVLRTHRELLAGFIEKLHKRLLLFSSAHFRAPPVLI